jgi:hypothetical protein
MLLRLFHKVEREELLPNSFYQVTTNTKTEYDIKIKKENYTVISLINIDAKCLIKYLQNEFNNTLQITIH